MCITAVTNFRQHTYISNTMNLLSTDKKAYKRFFVEVKGKYNLCIRLGAYEKSYPCKQK